MQNETVESRLSRYSAVRNFNVHNKIVDCITYDISDIDNSGIEEDVIFAYVYSNQYTEEVEYVCLGNNNISKDGSYMSGFIKYKYNSSVFNDSILNKVIKRLEIKDKYFMKKIIYKRLYRPDVIKNDINKLEILETGMFCVRLLAIYLCTTFVLKKNSRIFNKNYIDYLFDFDINKELRKDGIDAGIINSTFNITGQKLVPKGYYYGDDKHIKVREYKNESVLLYKLSKEVFRKTTPSFPIIINSIDLQGVNINVWDNSSLIEKIKNSKMISSNKKYNLKDVFSGRLTMFIMEDCGETLSKYITNGGRLLGDIISNTEALQSVLFQILHSIYILNKLGFIHGDTHLANITVRETVKWFNRLKNDIIVKKNNNSYSLFIVDNNKYKVNFYGAYITLIDLGRSINIENIENNKKELVLLLKKSLNNLSIDNQINIKNISNSNILILYNLCDIYKIIQGISTFMRTSTSFDSGGTGKFLKITEDIIIKKIKLLLSDENTNNDISLHLHTGELIKQTFHSMHVNEDYTKISSSEIFIDEFK